jgi:hypothetical protein
VENAERPIYLVARGAAFAGTGPDLPPGLAAFGTEDEARAFVAEESYRLRAPAASFRVVEYAFTGRVMEG